MHEIFQNSISTVLAPDEGDEYSIRDVISLKTFELFRRVKSEVMCRIPSPAGPTFVGRRVYIYHGEKMIVRDVGRPDRPIRGVVISKFQPVSDGKGFLEKTIHLTKGPHGDSPGGIESSLVLWEEISHSLHRGNQLGGPIDDLLGHLEIFGTYCVSDFFKDASLADQQQAIDVLNWRLGTLQPDQFSYEFALTRRTLIAVEWTEMLTALKTSAQGWLTEPARRNIDLGIRVINERIAT